MKLSMLLFFAVLCSIHVLAAPACPVVPALLCGGCIGSGPGFDDDTAINGDYVAVTIYVGNGTCSGTTPCTASPCEMTYIRSWVLGSGTKIELCIKKPGIPDDCHSVIASGGSEQEGSSSFIRCGGTQTYTANTDTLHATATGMCSGCS